MKESRPNSSLKVNWFDVPKQLDEISDADLLRIQSFERTEYRDKRKESKLNESTNRSVTGTYDVISNTQIFGKQEFTTTDYNGTNHSSLPTLVQTKTILDPLPAAPSYLKPIKKFR